MTKKKTYELPACPFCKNENVLVCPYDELYEVMESALIGGYVVVCDAQDGGCGGAGGWSKTKKGAMALWCRRE